MDDAKVTVSADWLADVVSLLNEMACHGVTMEGCADPADLMCAIAIALGHGDADDPWASVTAAINRMRES